MRGKLVVYISAVTFHVVHARTVKELCAKLGYSTARRMYRDKADGSTVHVGYVVGPYWMNAYLPYEGELS